MKIDIEVRRMGRRWFAYLIVDGNQRDCMACSQKRDIGWICREMLRWLDKTGGTSAWAASARRRQVERPVGKVWTNIQLKEELR